MCEKMNVEDYDFLYILSSGEFKNCYKVKHKVSGEEYIWKSVDYSEMSEEKKQELMNQINSIAKIDHPNIIKCYNSITHEDSTTFYVGIDACVESNLAMQIEKLKTNNEYFSEAFIWRTIYHICCVNKIYFVNESLCSENIFLSPENDIKLHLLDFLLNNTINRNRNNFVNNLVKLILELCTLEVHDFDKMEITIPNYYTEDLKKFLIFLQNLNSATKPDVILCHPTVLIKQTKYKQPLTKISNSKKYANKFEAGNSSPDSDYHIRLDNLRNRESAVKLKEEFLRELERNLYKREKKIALQERLVKEKMQRANLYLKRCKESKSSINVDKENLKSTDILYEEQDTSYSADPGDTSIIPTSTKLRAEDICRPNVFQRVPENRKVRFKGHSPLKEKCFNREFKVPFSDRSTPTSESLSEKSSVGQSKKKGGFFRMLSTRSKKNLVPAVEENVNFVIAPRSRPVSWSEENKRQAFELLRIMNEEAYKDELLKHTQL